MMRSRNGVSDLEVRRMQKRERSEVGLVCVPTRVSAGRPVCPIRQYRQRYVSARTLTVHTGAEAVRCTDGWRGPYDQGD